MNTKTLSLILCTAVLGAAVAEPIDFTGDPGRTIDALGDGIFVPELSGSVDLTDASAVVLGSRLRIRVAANSSDLEFFDWSFSIAWDADQDTATGFPGIDLSNTDSALIGADYFFEVSPFGYNVLDSSLSYIGGGQVDLHDNGVEFLIPLALLGGDDGVANYKVVASRGSGGETESLIIDDPFSFNLDYLTDVGAAPAVSVVGVVPPPPPEPPYPGGTGPIVIMGIDGEDGGVGGHGPISNYESLVSSVYAGSSSGRGILVLGGDTTSGFSQVRSFWDHIGDAIGRTITYVSDPAELLTVNLTPFRMIAIVSDELNTGGGLTVAQNNSLSARAPDFANFVNGGGGIFGLSSVWFGRSVPYGYLGMIGGGVTTTDSDYAAVDPTTEGLAIGVNDGFDICCWHNTFQTYPAFLKPLAYVEGTFEVAALGGVNAIIPSQIECPREVNLFTQGTGRNTTVLANVLDEQGDALVVEWEVDGAIVRCHCSDG